MGKVTSMMEARLKRGIVAPSEKRAFKAYDTTRSRVLLKTGYYSDPIEHSRLWQVMADNIDNLHPDVAIAISRAEDNRRNSK